MFRTEKAISNLEAGNRTVLFPLCEINCIATIFNFQEVQDKEATTSSKPATHFVDKEPAELKKSEWFWYFINLNTLH